METTDCFLRRMRRQIPDRPRFHQHWRNVMREPEVSLPQNVHADFTKWLMCSSQMKQHAEWYDTCLTVTHVLAVNIYWCWWAHSTHAARHSYFDPLFFYFCPLFPVFRLLATSDQSSEMKAGPSGTCLSSLRSRDEMKVIMWIRHLGEHLASQVRLHIWVEEILFRVLYFTFLECYWRKDSPNPACSYLRGSSCSNMRVNKKIPEKNSFESLVMLKLIMFSWTAATLVLVSALIH